MKEEEDFGGMVHSGAQEEAMMKTAHHANGIILFTSYSS